MTKEGDFQGFSPAAAEFLWGIRFNNEREWFESHKETYITQLSDPLNALGRTVHGEMERRHHLGCQLRVSRIYRDARRLFGRGPYKDHLWLSLRQPGEDWDAAPSFFFELRPERCMYGMGCYFNRPDAMARFRAEALRAPERLEALVDYFAGQKRIKLCGEDYKRAKGSISPAADPWFNKRMLWFARWVDWGEMTESPRLAKTMVRDFTFLMPLYQYFLPYGQRKEAAQ